MTFDADFFPLYRHGVDYTGSKKEERKKPKGF
jgi:hypothetical protein